MVKQTHRFFKIYIYIYKPKPNTLSRFYQMVKQQLISETKLKEKPSSARAPMNLKHISVSAMAPRVLPPSSREHSHIGHRRSVWSDQRLASTLESFHLPRLMCCRHGAAPQASLTVFQFFTLFFSLTSLPFWVCCGLKLSLSLSDSLFLFELKFNKLALQLQLHFINCIY